MTRREPRTAACSREDAHRRIQDARAFVEAATLAATERAAAWHDVAVSNAVHAAIASADVICCVSIQKRSSGTDHADAAGLLETVVPIGRAAARSLRAVIALKAKAEYLPTFASRTDVKTALRHATRLVELAEGMIAG